MADLRLPLAAALDINRFTGGTIEEYDKGLTNAIVDRRGDRLYITQRPAIDVFESRSFDTHALTGTILPTGTGQTTSELRIDNVSAGTYGFRFRVRIHPDHEIKGAGTDPFAYFRVLAYDSDDNLLTGFNPAVDWVAQVEIRDYTAAPYRKLAVATSQYGTAGVTLSGEGVHAIPSINSLGAEHPDAFSFLDVLAEGIDAPVDTAYLVLRVVIFERNNYTGAFQFADIELLDDQGAPVYTLDLSAVSEDWTTFAGSLSLETYTVNNTQGRGAYYWDAGGALYFVADDTVYRGSYANPLGTITNGTQRCYFHAIGPDLVLLDPESGEGWKIDISGTLTQITDTDFPPEQTPAIGLASGGAVLNGRLYVLGTDGVIYGSDLEDGSSWDALNFLTAERDPDGGTYLGKHHDHVIAMGPRTIEVFYDAANPTGSPLARRQDVAYNLGCNAGESVWVDGDRIWFCGVDPSGTVGVYVMERFAPRKVSAGMLDDYLTAAIVTEGYRAVGCALSAAGRTFFILTLFDPQGGAESTLVYDDATKFWGCWETPFQALNRFPLIAWTQRTSVLPRPGEGILSNGSLLTMGDGQVPQDSERGQGYIRDWIVPGYYAERAGSGTPIEMRSRVGMQDMGTDKVKFLSELRVIADRSAQPAVCAIRYANERSDEDAWSAMRILDLARAGGKITRLGKFHRRNFEVIYNGPQQVRLESLELTAQVGTT